MRSNVARRRSVRVGHPVPLIAVLLEVLWVYPWAMWAGTWHFLDINGTPLGFILAVVLAVAAEEVARYCLAQEWPLAVVRLATLSVLAVLLAFAVRLQLGGGLDIWRTEWWRDATNDLAPLLAAAAFGVFLLWRGIAVGRTALTFDDLHRRFYVGLAAFVALLVLWGATARTGEFQRVFASASIFVVTFFFVSLMGLALVNLRSSWQGMSPHAVFSAMFNQSWISLYLGLVLLIAVLSAALALAVSSNVLKVVLVPLSLVGTFLLNAVIYVIVYPLGFVASGGLYAVRYLLSLIGITERPELNLLDLSEVRDAVSGETPSIPPEVVLGLKLFLVALLVGIALFFLARALFRRARAASDDVESEHESLWSWEGFKLDVRSFLARLLWLLLRSEPASPPPATPPVAVTVTEEVGRENLLTVREIYQGVLWEGRAAGLPRRASRTPYEYEEQLRTGAAAGADEIRAITDAYVAERYGGLPTPRVRLEPLNHLWRQLRSAFHRKE